jgi:hypothetical protein
MIRRACSALTVLGLTCWVTSLLQSNSSAAVVLSLVNPSFESDTDFDVFRHYANYYSTNHTPTGWSVVSDPGIGRYSTVEFFDGVFFDRGATDGLNSFHFEGGPGALYQTLDTKLVSFSQYQLNVDVGWRYDRPRPEFEIQLLAGDTVLATFDDNSILQQGDWVTAKLIYTLDPTQHDVFDEYLTVRLAHTSEGTWGIQVNFDNVVLTAVPEPSAWAVMSAVVLGVGGLGWRRRRLAVASAAE